MQAKRQNSKQITGNLATDNVLDVKKIKQQNNILKVKSKAIYPSVHTFLEKR